MSPQAIALLPREELFALKGRVEQEIAWRDEQARRAYMEAAQTLLVRIESKMSPVVGDGVPA